MEKIKPENPDIIILSGQTEESVKDILKASNDPVSKLEDVSFEKYNEIKDLKNLAAKSSAYFGKEACQTANKILKEKEIKLIFDEAPYVDEGLPYFSYENKRFDKNDLLFSPELKKLAGLKCEEIVYFDKPTNKPKLKQDFDQFHEWRKTAGLRTNDLADGSLNTTRELMDQIISSLSKSFPHLNVCWSSGTWNPVLIINNAETTITLRRLSLSYNGLLNITDEINAQSIIANIVLKKVKELFI